MSLSQFPKWGWPTFFSALLSAFYPALGSAQVVINELMYNAVASAGAPENPREEFIELYNPTNAAIDLGGWSFSRGVSFTFPAPTSIPAGSYLVVAADLATFSSKYPAVTDVCGPWTGQLSNSGERVQLVDETGAAIDELRYSDQGDWAERVRETLAGANGWTWASAADDLGHSLELRNPALPNDLGQNWGSSNNPGGTPGRPNSIASSDLAPLIVEVAHSPAVPNFTQPVTISATLANEGAGPITADVRWRVSTATPGPFNSSPMSDPDADGRWAAALPPQGEGTIVEFYLESSDGSNARTWPAPTDQGQTANAHYQVDSAPQTPGTALYRVVMTAADRNQWNGINRQSDAQLNVTFIASEAGSDAIRYRSGMRVRGNGSRTFNPPPMRINIPREDPWNGDTKLNVNSRFSFLQFIGMHLFQSTGMTAPDAKRVSFRLNGENQARADDTMRGFYLHLEPIGDEMIEDKFPDDDGGNLYKKRSADPDRDEKRWGVHFENDVVYDEPNWYLDDDWSKLTNESKDDWSDLQNFVEVMDRARPATYLEQVSAVANIDQWCRWFAIMAILNSFETNLSNGIDDDYSMYRGLTDQRFVLLPHDLDTIFGGGDTTSDPDDSIFPMLTANIPRANEDGRIPQLVPFFENPTLRAKYFSELKSLLENEFSKPVFDAAIQNMLGTWATQADRDSLVTYMDARRGFILEQINPGLSVASALPLSGGFPRTTQAQTALSGAYGLIGTARILVNGQPATLNASLGTWAVGNVALLPGINRVTMRALDESDQVVDTQHIDLWYDDGDTQALTGPITTNTTLTANAGPYTINGEVVVQAGATLTIEPGTNFYLARDAKLTVNGVLRAVGSEFARIRFGPTPNAPLVADPAGNGGLPNGPPKSDGIQFVNSLSDQNLLSFVDVLHAQGVDGSVGVHDSEAVLDNMTFAGSHLRLVYANRSSVTLQNSTFPDMFAPGEGPDALGLDNISEHVKGEGAYPAGGHFIIRHNTFGTNAGHNDVIDVDSGRFDDPNRSILQILDNTFLGAGDEHLDLGGDVYVAGNLFMNIRKDDETSDRGYANAISTGDSGTNTTIVVARNVFWDVDHAINLKRGTTTIFENNTVVKIHPDFSDRFGNPNVGSAINLYVDEPAATPGDGAYAANNIFWEAPRVFGNADRPAGTNTPLELHHNLLSPALAMTSVGNRAGTILDLGNGNLIGPPSFLDEQNGDFQLWPGSAGVGAGQAGQDLGAEVPNAISVTGEPPAVTTSTSATLTVGGPGMFSFQYRLNGTGSWSAETPIGSGFDPANGTIRTAQIALTNLANGSYFVEVRGRDFAGNWQTEPTVSESWLVIAFVPGSVRINEVLAANRTAFSPNGVSYPDLIELHNPGIGPFAIGGMTLTDDPALPAKFTIPAGTTLAGGQYLTIYAESGAAYPGIFTGFSLSSAGESLFLYNNSGGLVDSITFGLQVPDFSIGRTGRDGTTWALTKPTPGATNVTQPVGDPRRLRINEWLAASEVLFDQDFVELYNPGGLPARIDGFSLTDSTPPASSRRILPALSFIPANGFSVFEAIGSSPALSANELDFRLSATHEWVYLYDQDGNELDKVHLQAEGSDISRGRSPDGGTTLQYFTLPTPGTFNVSTNEIVTTTTLVPLDAVWSYEQSNTDLGTAWTAAGFNDASWPTGPALLYQDSDPLNGPAGTLLELNPPTTHYFRRAFNFTGNPATTEIEFDLFADDGAVVYLNGTEVRRVRMPGGTITHTTFASTGQGNAGREGPFAIPPGSLLAGQNVIAASVHQDDGASGDVVFGLELRSIVTTSTGGDDEYTRALNLLNGLRITELMYHPADTEALEFIELQNIGPVPLQLQGVRFTDGIEFVFPEMVLGVGSYVMVVADPAAFAAKYGGAISVAGQFGGRLNNDGEQIVLTLPPPFEAAIMRFTYNDSWYRESDGDGYSLEILDSFAPAGAWHSLENWRGSSVLGGTPAQISAPVITSLTTALTTLGDPFSYQITATNIPSSYSASGLPDGLSINTQSGEISGNTTEFGTFAVALTATNPGGTGTETLFIDVASSGPFAAYEWSRVPTPVPAGSPIPVSARAVDSQGRTVLNYNENVQVGAFIGTDNGSSIVITEAWDRSPDYFEIQNVSPGTVDTTGWFVVVNQAFAFGGQSGVNVAAPTTWALPASMASGQVQAVTDDQGDNYFGGDIPWTQNNFGGTGRRGWVMLIDRTGALADFVAWGYSENELASINLTVRGFTIRIGRQWTGAGVPWNSANNRALLRTGVEDTDTPADWIWDALSRGVQNGRMRVPFPGGFEAIASTPDAAAFSDGVWNGLITVNESATDAVLILDDRNGHLAISDRFEVSTLPSPVITSPADAIAVAGQPFSYQITATNVPGSFGAAPLPAGLTVDAGGLISGMPTSAGTTSVMVSATNGSGTGTRTVSLQVQADSDGDGMPDDWETSNGLNPNSAADALLDNDRDGLSNRGEFFAGTNPHDALSSLALQISAFDSASNTITLQWSSIPGKRYQITTLTEPDTWPPLPGGSFLASSITSEITVEIGSNPTRLFRVETGLNY